MLISKVLKKGDKINSSFDLKSIPLLGNKLPKMPNMPGMPGKSNAAEVSLMNLYFLCLTIFLLKRIMSFTVAY
jgi:hypothetical protein